MRLIPFSACPAVARHPAARAPGRDQRSGRTGGRRTDAHGGGYGRQRRGLLQPLTACDGTQSSSQLRRVYLAQYTAEAMLNPGTRHLRNNAVPLLWHGEQVTVA